jgi:hypothetical protein
MAKVYLNKEQFPPQKKKKSKGWIEEYEKSMMKMPKEDLEAILKREEDLWNS